MVLHRREIVNRKGPFEILKDKERDELFTNDLLVFLKKQQYRLVAVTIDKKTHLDKYGCYAHHPYDYCLAAILERYCGLMNFFNSIGDALAESRGGTEDNHLKRAYRHIHQNGTRFRSERFFRQSLTSGELKIKPKTADIAGLQVADLLVYHARQEMLIERGRIQDKRSDFAKEICEIMSEKYNKQKYNGRIYGYGKIYLSFE